MTHTLVASATREHIIGFDKPFTVIGERINPTGRKKLAAEMGEVARGSTHYHVLFLIGALLFVITFAINSLAARLVGRRRAGEGEG